MTNKTPVHISKCIESIKHISKCIESINQEIYNLAKRRQELREELEELETSGSVYQIAVLLHDTSCKWNHTDECSWSYECQSGKHDWTGSAHGRYLYKARKLLESSSEKNIDADTVFNMIQLYANVVKEN